MKGCSWEREGEVMGGGGRGRGIDTCSTEAVCVLWSLFDERRSVLSRTNTGRYLVLTEVYIVV